MVKKKAHKGTYKHDLSVKRKARYQGMHFPVINL